MHLFRQKLHFICKIYITHKRSIDELFTHTFVWVIRINILSRQRSTIKSMVNPCFDWPIPNAFQIEIYLPPRMIVTFHARKKEKKRKRSAQKTNRNRVGIGITRKISRFRRGQGQGSRSERFNYTSETAMLAQGTGEKKWKRSRLDPQGSIRRETRALTLPSLFETLPHRPCGGGLSSASGLSVKGYPRRHN